MNKIKGIQRYNIKDSPIWVKKLSNEDLLRISFESKNNNKTSEIRKSGRGICYLLSEVVNTSGEKNETYLLKIWELNNANTLQSASINELLIKSNEHINVHKVSVIRDGVVLDKSSTLNVRIIDDEKYSSQGSINNLKKVHFVINDLKIDDIFVFEYTIVTLFDYNNFLDKKYFNYIKNMPDSYWYYIDYSFKLIQNRDQEISIIKKHFVDDNNKIDENRVVLNKGEIFTLNLLNFQNENKAGKFNPYIEIATKSTYTDISKYMFSLYKKYLNETIPIAHKIYSILNLNSPDISLETKIQNIIEYVQNQIVYLYDAEVMHSYLPQHSLRTLEAGSGDCKAKSILLVNLLNIVSIKSSIVLVNYSLDYYLKTALPSPFVFNHVIVKIEYKDKIYFIDPTQNSAGGILEKRSQPLFSNYLEITEGSDIATKSRSVLDGINIEDEIYLNLKENECLIKSKTIYRNESADFIRGSFQKHGPQQMLQYQNKIILEMLSYPIEKDLSSILKDSKYGIVKDDVINNIIITDYEARLINPYQLVNDLRIFKFYNHINISFLLNNIDSDYPVFNFFSYPLKYTIKIESDLFINKKQSILHNIKIENAYFTFSNAVNAKTKIAEVVSKYIPKTFDCIKKEDRESLRRDYVKINNSYFGIGLVFIDAKQYFRSKWYFLPIVFILMKVILYVLGIE